MRVYYEGDVEPGALAGRTIAVLGYGNQGGAHALNLRDAGHAVIVAQRPGGANYDRATRDGFAPMTIEEAARRGDLLIFALPDETTPEIYEASIAPHLRPGQALGFVHGFNVRFGFVRPPKDVDVILVAPKGPGTLVRDAFVRGGGIACVVAVDQDASGRALRTALAWGAGVGGGKGGMMEATFAEECESDLFGEQAVLCGGMIELMTAAFETLVAEGFAEEIAYVECVHEAKQIMDLIYAEGLAGMRARISKTAAFGGLTRGPVVVTEEVRRKMREILAEVRSGGFAEEWRRECAAGRPRLTEAMRNEANGRCEAAATRVRGLLRGGKPPASAGG